ncbi:unnamed protein product [Miscanthus lutarioriparius]|uniref:Transmembrane 9 superfamily member n=1 Tax=Miscanthus lutarioriparius TaxID=422564 RepID=A0A811PTY4_9POAL|nr:unnamed protein product [Miscanthus lutarioriparius]
MASAGAAAVLAVVVLACALGARADGSDHKYKEGIMFRSTPTRSGLSTIQVRRYRYYDLPFCAPEHPKDKKEALGEVLNGDRWLMPHMSWTSRKTGTPRFSARKYCQKSKLPTSGMQLPRITTSRYIPFEKRMDKYSKSSSMPQHLEIHWFSIINSCVTVLLLTGFLATILMRVLKNDFIKYSHEDESLEDQEETGWKYIHGDVFRFPKQKSVFAALIGSGTQLLALAIFIFLLALVGVFYPYNRGALFTALVVIYALTSGIAGYTATSFYLQLEGTNWVRNLILTGCLFCGPLFLTFCFLNTVAIAYSATAALPFGTIIVIILIWALVTSPLLVLGGIAGKNSNTEFQSPCQDNQVPREILSFHAFVTVALTYFQLAVEDHEWWWRSVLCGGSTGIFIFFYCIYYYHARSDMSGFMQTSFFFGYMTCVCYGFFLMLGTVGFRASLLLRAASTAPSSASKHWLLLDVLTWSNMSMDAVWVASDPNGETVTSWIVPELCPSASMPLNLNLFAFSLYSLYMLELPERRMYVV